MNTGDLSDTRNAYAASNRPTSYVRAVSNRLSPHISLDGAASKIAALGVPGLVLLVATSATGYAGAAALTAALAALGPGGMIGGIATLGITGLISEAVAKYGTRTIVTEVAKELHKRGETTQTILAKVNRIPLSQTLKLQIEDALNEIDQIHGDSPGVSERDVDDHGEGGNSDAHTQSY